MVSLVIMLMIVTVAFAGFRIGLDAWERGGRAVESMDRRATVERLIQRQLAVAYPLEFNVNQHAFVMFRGSSDRMQFVSDYSLFDGSVDFRKIDYAIHEGKFLYGEKPLFGYIPTEDEPLPQTELATFRTVTFKFMSKDEKDNPVWKSEWKLGEGVPIAVQVQIDSDILVVRMVNR